MLKRVQRGFLLTTWRCMFWCATAYQARYPLISHTCYAPVFKLFDSHNFYFELNTSDI